MKAWRFYAFSDMRMDDIPVPPLRPGHVLVQMLVVQPSVTEAQLAFGIPTLAFEKIKKRLRGLQALQPPAPPTSGGLPAWTWTLRLFLTSIPPIFLCVVVGVSGIVIDSDPSFGVLAASTVGNVRPLSVESEILTFAVFTGAPEVPATFQVTVWVEPPSQLSAVFGCVTTNGPAAVVEVNCMLSEFTPPPFAR